MKLSPIRILLRQLTMLVAVLSLTVSNMFGQDQTTRLKQVHDAAKKAFVALDGIDVDGRFIPRFIRGSLDTAVDLTTTESIKRLINKSAAVFRINPLNDDFDVSKIEQDELGMRHVVLQQKYKGIPVYGAMIALHVDKGGVLTCINGMFVPELSIDVSPAVSGAQAQQLLQAYLGWNSPALGYADSKLLIAPQSPDPYQSTFSLAWTVTLASNDSTVGSVTSLIGAKDGRIQYRTDGSVGSDAVGSGWGLTFHTNMISGNWYELNDVIRNVRTKSAASPYNQNLVWDTDNNWNQDNQKNPVYAHVVAEAVWDFWKTKFNRNGFDDAGHSLTSMTGEPGVNAHWDTQSWEAHFPDGGNRPGGVFAYPFTDKDIVAHEFTHGLAQATVNFNLADVGSESRALNEAFGDIFGLAVANYTISNNTINQPTNWAYGGNYRYPTINNVAYQRYLDLPLRFDLPDGVQRAEYYHDAIWENSGAGNEPYVRGAVLCYAYVHLSDATKSSNSIGIEKATAVAWRSLVRNYLSSNSGYVAARHAFLQSAIDLYGVGSEYNKIALEFNDRNVRDDSPGISIAVQNNIPFSGGNTSQVSVDPLIVTSPYYNYWQPGFTHQIAAIDLQHVNNLIYQFQSWSDGLGQTHQVSAPSQSTTYTAYFHVLGPEQVVVTSAGGAVGDPVLITWQRHPNSDVKYCVYRKTKINGIMGPEQLVTPQPLAWNVTSFTDPDYLNAGYSNTLLFYDVRAFHVPSSTYASQSWTGTGYGSIANKTSPGNSEMVGQEEAATDFSLRSYPNPFNPSTQLEYSVPVRGYVSLAIFDALGRRVTELLNKYQPAGKYSVVWSGTSGDGRPVSSGVYFARLSVVGESGKPLAVITNRLFLMK
jgi:bacillolysin